MLGWGFGPALYLKRMKVKFLKSPGLYRLAYFVGDTAEVNDELGKEMIQNGFAELIQEVEFAVEKPVKEIPEKKKRNAKL